MTTAVIASTAAVAALVLVTLVVTASRRGRSGSEGRIADALGELGGRMDALATELAGALARVQADSLRARALGELGYSLDLDELLARTAEAASSVPGVDAVIVSVTGVAGETSALAAVGIPKDDAADQVIAGPPGGRGVRAVGLTYRYSEHDEPPGALRSGVAVPLESDGEQIGFLAVYSHDPAPPLAPDALSRLEAVAQAAGPAIDNARRYREIRQLAVEDGLTGLSNRQTFYDSLSHEVARAHRYGRDLTLIVLDLDDFKQVNDRIGHLAGDSVLAETAARLREAVRSADVACRIGGDEFAVILPESTRIDAEGLFARVVATLRREPLDHAPNLCLSGGIAELEPDDDAVSLFERADAALYRAKAHGKGTAA
ncbi:MAG TPA: sensor domain-containing diguanylate cyclase [Gaiella sp.]